jgi:hypothetical protein
MGLAGRAEDSSSEGIACLDWSEGLRPKGCCSQGCRAEWLKGSSLHTVRLLHGRIWIGRRDCGLESRSWGDQLEW